MDNPEIAPVYREMDERTRDFLETITKMLREQFSADMSSVYLNKMVEHLETFYDDVVTELVEKKNKCVADIEELLGEAKNLKRSLNVDFKITSNANNEIPLSDYLKRLDEDLVEMRTLFKKRQEEIENCLCEQQQLCEAMDEPLRRLSLDPLASELEVAEFEEYLIDLKSQKLTRENEINCLKQEIGSMCDELDLPMSESVGKSFPPTMVNLQKLRRELEAIQHQRETIKRESELMIKKLESLWDCLEVPSSVRTKFRNLAQIYKQSSLEEIESELKRCKKLKQENIKLFVEKLRAQIVEAWDKIHRSESERNKFSYFQSEVYTEDLLELHEMELEECQNFYETNHLIFEKYAEFNAWCEKWEALEAKKNEPNRYNNRGGQLLREERERKMVNAKIPEIEVEIKTLAEAYSNSHNKEFLINGEPIIDIIDRKVENIGNAKVLKSARKANGTSKPPSTPKTPMNARGQTTLKRMPSSVNLALASGNTGKRMLLDVPGRNNNITSSSTSKKANLTASHRREFATHTQTKRNLFGQINSPNNFLRPTSSVKPLRSKAPVKTMATLSVPTFSLPRRRSNGLNNISASKIVKKYRRSQAKRMSQMSSTDGSLINYDTFENQMKTSHFTNSSVVEHQENTDRNKNAIAKTSTNLHARTILRTPNRNVSTLANHTKSPLLTASGKKFKAKDLGLIL